MNFMVDNKENYKFDLGVKGLTFLHDKVGKPQSNLAFLDQLQCDNQRLFGNINFSAFT